MRTLKWKKIKNIVPSATYANTAALGSPTWQIDSAENLDLELVLSGSSATPSLTVKVQFPDQTGTYYDAGLISTALAADGRVTLKAGLAFATAANASLSAVLPKKIKLVFGGSLGGGSATVAVKGRAI